MQTIPIYSFLGDKENLKKNTRNLLLFYVGMLGLYAASRNVAKKHAENESIDENNKYLKNESIVSTSYEKFIKPTLDKVLAFVGLVVLFPLMAVIAIIVWVDDPGSIFFTQKRVGKDGHFFMLHKYRTMKRSAPHDIPTHQLENPEQYITKVGKFLRKTSLDELPQIWDIFRGKMSIIGPRPALWNQDDLVAERQKYGANSIYPGLTGLAQIQGRDELLISEKAKIDGEYVKILRLGGIRAFEQDIRCFIGTVGTVLKHDGVVEGGTGALQVSSNVCQTKKITSISIPSAGETGFEDYGHLKHFDIEKNREIRVLITGAGSYIGESFRRYTIEHYPNIAVDTIDMMDGSWRKADFSPYDCVFHVAGIAHTDLGKVSEETKAKYYAVNTDLAIETARKAKDSGVKQFILMSSMIIYGDSAPYGKEKVIDEHTIPAPMNVYGDSKWRADVGVRELQTDIFHVAILRPPMIYGCGAKGNYQTLAKLAKKFYFFPDVANSRSMLYIENLCEFVSLLTLSGESGIYFPQNFEYIKTAQMAKMISDVTGNRMKNIKILNIAVIVAQHIPGRISCLIDKAFGNFVYDQKLSRYEGLNYQITDIAESIRRTERIDTASNINNGVNILPNSNEINKDISEKKILMIASVASIIDLFNTDNINILLSLGYKVDVAANFEFGSITSQERVDEYKQELADHGITPFHVPIPRDVKDISNIINSYRIVKALIDTGNYNMIHCHSPIGGVVARLAAKEARKRGTKVIYTAHGFHFFSGASRKAWLLYYPIEKFCAGYTDLLITINQEDYKIGKTLGAKKTVYVPGIGVHIDEIKNLAVDRASKRAELSYQDSDFVFMSTGQVSLRKNHEVVIKAMALLQDHNIKYLIVGFGEEEKRLKRLVKELGVDNCVRFVGYRSDVKELLHVVDAFVFPSRQEGLPVALMEAMAVGLPIVASRIRGNVDLIADGVNGYLVDCDKPEQFTKAMEQIVCSDTSGMREANQRRINRFDTSAVNKKMTRLYETIA
ncbi:glycosyltransferase [Schaedlerella arabinosiphila]|uniref:Glycosyltransferase n=1 Tax=Schaedlerella arabinosiphila TaxID=2044587 RepID=A0A3R8JN55_9FIRM|nr:glycosyltransferase [Schaedlerella arabinosiphila]